MKNEMMKAAMFRGAGQVEVTEVPVPQVGPGEVLVRVHYCGICGSDIEAYRAGTHEPGRVIGHEFAGEVVAVGQGVHRWAVGDRVTVNDAIPCGRCLFCRRGQPALCDDLLMPGVTLDGGMAEAVALPARALHRLPEGVSMRQGALAEPLAVALHGVRRSALRPGDRALLIGAGPIGLLTLQCALLAGAREVYVSETNAARAALAEQLGATAVFDPTEHNLAVELDARTEGQGPAVIYICTGSAAAFEDAITLVGKGGQILLLGLGVEPAATDTRTLALHELNIQGSYLGYGEFPAALDYIAQGRVNVKTLISHEITLEDVAAQGFALLDQPDVEVVRVLVKIADE